MNLLVKFATNPVWPMALAAALYALICYGWAAQGRPWFGAMWACYSAAIVCMYMDSLK